MRARWRDDRGQAMVLVALGVIVLLGALALAVEFGYGLTQRRVMQNASDSAALGVGRYLATNVIQDRGEIAFTVTEKGACEVARSYVEANRSFAPQANDRTFTMRFASEDPATHQPVGWTIVPVEHDCAGAATTLVSPDVRYVRVLSTITYHSLVSTVLGFPNTSASASARAKVFGTPVAMGAPVWPMVRHYDADDFDAQIQCPQPPCGLEDIVPTTFWSQNEDDVVYANGFKGMVDLSRDSPRYTKAGTPGVPQLITESDTSGTPPADLKDDESGNCPSGWDTAGGEDPQNQDKQCSIPNWFYYGFAGTLSLTSTYQDESVLGGNEPPTNLPGRSVCSDGERPDPAPSCDDTNEETGLPGSQLGDWVEVAGGNVGSNESQRMIDRIREEGFETALSDLPIDPHKPNAPKYGKALIVLIYLWDCAESYSPNAEPGHQWDLIDGPGMDCSKVSKNDKPDRVHLFTAAPFTFYEGLVDTSEIRGFWGGLFGNVIDCSEWEGDIPLCELNPLSNSAALVADDNYDGP